MELNVIQSRTEGVSVESPGILLQIFKGFVFFKQGLIMYSWLPEIPLQTRLVPTLKICLCLPSEY